MSPSQVAVVLRNYDRGDITNGELLWALIQALAVSDLPNELPPDVEAILRAEVEGAPTSDEEWATVQMIALGSVCAAPGTTVEELDPAQARALYRQGIERIRQRLNITPSSVVEP